MNDVLTAAAGEAARKPGDPVLVHTVHGRTWRFGTPDIRPSRLKRYAVLAEAVAGKKPEQISNAEAVELASIAEEMLRLALPPADREAFDEAPLSGTEIGRIAADYFAALGVSVGESVASPASSPGGRRRSRRTSRR